MAENRRKNKIEKRLTNICLIGTLSSSAWVEMGKFCLHIEVLFFWDLFLLKL